MRSSDSLGARPGVALQKRVGMKLPAERAIPLARGRFMSDRGELAAADRVYSLAQEVSRRTVMSEPRERSSPQPQLFLAFGLSNTKPVLHQRFVRSPASPVQVQQALRGRRRP